MARWVSSVSSTSTTCLAPWLSGIAGFTQGREAAGFVDAAAFEEMKRGGDAAIKTESRPAVADRSAPLSAPAGTPSRPMRPSSSSHPRRHTAPSRPARRDRRPAARPRSDRRTRPARPGSVASTPVTQYDTASLSRRRASR